MELNERVETQFRLAPEQKSGLKKLGIITIRDLLFYFPVRYGETSEMKYIENLIKDEQAIIFGKVISIKTGKAYIKKTPMAEATIEDSTGRIRATWFHQPYIAKMIKEGSFVKVEGKVSARKNDLNFINPEIETISSLPASVGESLFGKGGEGFNYPVYSETKGITSRWIFHAIQRIFKSGILETIVDPIPEEILKEYNLPTLKSALVWIHTPQNENDRLASRKRFAFEEVFLLQLMFQKERHERSQYPSFKITKSEDEMKKFSDRFPFKETDAQKNAINEVLKDFKSGHAMSRLLEGDVGSGKTAVAASAVFATTTTTPENKNYGHLQTAYMVPTEILARQHFESFIKYFAHLNIQIGLITGSGCMKFPSKVNPLIPTPISRTQLLKWVANGEISILIGTHALIYKSVAFKNLGLVIIDEQHRFGTLQRQKLTRKDKIIPHLLSMTATPIPRTLALTIYGDLDLTLLDQMPHGRLPIITDIVIPTKRKEVYEKVRVEMKAGRQTYVICPRINEPDPDKEQALNVRSVKEEAIRLKKEVFPEYEIAIMHSKMTPKEKEKVMKDFENKKVDILVSTSVVEVGVNVPNATVMIIEGGERFGLSQLHQLRGRVIRSNHQAYCYVFAEGKSDKTIERLKALKTAKNGFELAEYDLSLRGSGELMGRRQWGISDLAMEAIKNIKMVEAARKEARAIIEKDISLVSYPHLREILDQRKDVHME